MSVHNKVIWITGASSGIGEALAIELSKLDCQLILSARNEERLMQTKYQCFGDPEDIFIVPVDLSKLDDVGEAYKVATAYFGRIDILINNAGILRDKNLLRVTDDDWDAIIDIHLTAPFKLTRALFPVMKEQKYGKIIRLPVLHHS